MPETIKTRAKWVWHSKRKKCSLPIRMVTSVRIPPARLRPFVRAKWNSKALPKDQLIFWSYYVFCFRDILTAEKFNDPTWQVLNLNQHFRSQHWALLKNDVVWMVQKTGETLIKSQSWNCCLLADWRRLIVRRRLEFNQSKCLDTSACRNGECFSIEIYGPLKCH